MPAGGATWRNVSSTARTAFPSGTPGAKFKESVAAGNCPMSVDCDRSARFGEPRKCIERYRSTPPTQDRPAQGCRASGGSSGRLRGRPDTDSDCVQMITFWSLAKRIVEDVVDQLRGDAERRCGAIDRQRERLAHRFADRCSATRSPVARAKHRNLRGPASQRFGIGSLETQLVLGAAHAGVESGNLDRLQIKSDSWHGGERGSPAAA